MREEMRGDIKKWTSEEEKQEQEIVTIARGGCESSTRHGGAVAGHDTGVREANKSRRRKYARAKYRLARRREPTNRPALMRDLYFMFL